jgi:hypothetical protein
LAHRDCGQRSTLRLRWRQSERTWRTMSRLCLRSSWRGA